MNNFALLSFSNADDLAHAVADAWLKEIEAAAGNPHTVALSGGRVALKFFAEVVKLVNLRKVSLAHVHFFWADERCVPPTDAESNYRPAFEILFEPLGISLEKVHRIRGELPPAQAVELATAEILKVFSSLYSDTTLHLPSRPDDTQPDFDIIFLGMGEDGHVASLFPTEPEDKRKDPAVFRAIANSPKPPPDRVTLGYGPIVAAKNVWVLASGNGKATALKDSLSPTGCTPLARVLQSRPHSKIFSDIPL